MNRRKTLRYLGAGLLLWVVLHLAFTTLDGLRDQREPADLGVILGNTVNPDGSLSARLASRLACGAAAFKAGRVRHLLVSGGLGKEGFYEGNKMQEYLVRQGIPAAAITVDNQGNTTAATVRNTLLLRPALHFNSVLVVSQFYHVTRTKMLFRQRGFTSVGSASPRYFELRDIYSLLREFPAFYQGLLTGKS